MLTLLLSFAHTAAPGAEAVIEGIANRFQENPNITGILNHMEAQQESVRQRRLESEFLTKGRNNFEIACMPCHGLDGKGTPAPGTDMTLGAPIAGSPRVTGRKDIPIKIMLKGMTGELDGRKFPGPMLPLESFDDEWIASTLTYIRRSWGNKAPLVTAQDVATVRAQIKDREIMWDSSEILTMAPLLIIEGHGQSSVFEIVLPLTRTRHLRISQHGRASGKYWSIHELEVYTK